MKCLFMPQPRNLRSLSALYFVAFFAFRQVINKSENIDIIKPYFSVQGAEQQNFSTFYSKMGKN